jgi:hypothetical protein
MSSRLAWVRKIAAHGEIFNLLAGVAWGGSVGRCGLESALWPTWVQPFSRLLPLLGGWRAGEGV